MFRRDLLATLLGLLPVSAVRSLVAAAAALLDDAAPGGVGTDDATADDSDDGDPSVRTAVVDRVEGDVAVLLFEDPAATRTVTTAVLPAAAREEGIVLRVPQGDSLALATVDRAATARRRRAAGDRFDDLAERAPDQADGENETAP